VGFHPHDWCDGMSKEAIDFRGAFQEVIHFSDTLTLKEISQCCRVTRSTAKSRWDAWHRPLLEYDAEHLKDTLKSIWMKHQGLIRQKGVKFNHIRSAGDMYRCWPSKDWFLEGELPFKEYWQFEFGDSSYNIWICDLPVAVQNLERIIGDLYLRMRWPKHDSIEARQLVASSVDAFVEQLVEEKEYQDMFDFTLRPCSFFMEQIWWSDFRVSRWHGRPRQDEFMAMLEKRPYLRTGQLLPRHPQPTQGLSLLPGQESVFMTWDRHEVWFYACYVD